jgi:hypothetical protein
VYSGSLLIRVLIFSFLAMTAEQYMAARRATATYLHSASGSIYTISTFDDS